MGYVQGFNFIVGNLLKILDNSEHTFWVFLGLLSEYNITNFYTDNMPRLKLVLYQLNCFI
jgi:hypothetical protein